MTGVQTCALPISTDMAAVGRLVYLERMRLIYSGDTAVYESFFITIELPHTVQAAVRNTTTRHSREERNG